MAHMKCVCGYSMYDGTGEIVYDVYIIDEVKKYMEIYPELDCFDKSNWSKNELEYYTYFWKCYACDAIHAWTKKPKECFRRYEIVRNDSSIKIDDIKKMKELLIIKEDAYERIETAPFKDLILKNPIRPEKYFISDDLSRAYIYNTEKNVIEKTYDLKCECYSNIHTDYILENDWVIYHSTKTNNEPDYIVENGKRILIEDDFYPHTEIHYIPGKKPDNWNAGYEALAKEPKMNNKKS